MGILTSHASSNDITNVSEKGNIPSEQSKTLFENPFQIEDIAVFDDLTLQRMIKNGNYGLNIPDLARSLHYAPASLVRRIRRTIPVQQRAKFTAAWLTPCSRSEVMAARKRVLDGLFWELTYWKTPDLYEELTEGEQLHPGIFQRLGPQLHGKIVLDAGAGSGRATFECLRYGAKLIYAMEPSPGLLRILEQKKSSQPANNRIISYQGRFHAIPLPDQSVDIALSCSAFTAEAEQGGEAGLAEMKRVTRSGGTIVLIWPRIEDYDWLIAHRFQYVSLPVKQEMRVYFRSMESALRCAGRFYAHNGAVASYLRKRKQPELPFSLLGFNPPHDYCWLTV